jgi:hypothetical protein
MDRNTELDDKTHKSGGREDAHCTTNESLPSKNFVIQKQKFIELSLKYWRHLVPTVPLLSGVSLSSVFCLGHANYMTVPSEGLKV